MFVTIDVVFGILILIVAIAGLVNGFRKEVFGKVTPVVSCVLSFLFYQRLVEPVESYVKNHILSVILSFLLIFIIVFIVMKIIELVIDKIFGGEIFKSLDRTLGFFFGIIEGMALVCIILMILRVQPWFDMSRIFEGSFCVKFFGNFIDSPVKAISESIG